MTHVTTIIVSFNTRAELTDCLRSLQDFPPTRGHDVIVVDNASTDDSVCQIRKRFPWVRVIESDRNLGFGAANNVGMRAASGDLCLLLNSDTIVGPGALDTLVDTLLASPDLAAVGPRIVDAEGRAELSFGHMIGPWHELRQKVVGRLYDRRFRPVVSWVERATKTPSHPDWVSGACLLVRRDDAVAAGLFDERYFLYAEDVDFCAALRGLGKRVAFCPASQIVHLRGRSRRHRPAATEQAYRQSQIRFYRKHHPRWAALLTLYLRIRGRL